jgi:hypothetical protein
LPHPPFRQRYERIGRRARPDLTLVIPLLVEYRRGRDVVHGA